MEARQLPDGWDKDLPSFPADTKGMATRESSEKLSTPGEEYPLADWRIGGPGKIEQDQF